MLFLFRSNIKVLFENFVSLGALKAINLIMPLIVLPYVIKIIGLSLYGEIVFAIALINYFIPIVDYSFAITGTREVARSRNNNERLNEIVSEIYFVKGVLCIISIFILVVLIILVPSFNQNALLYIFSIPMLIGNMLFPDWFFQGIEKMKYISVINIVVKIISVAIIFLFLKTKKDFLVYPISFSLGYMISGFIGLYILLNRFKLKISPIKKDTFIELLKSNFPIFVNQFLPSLYNNTTTFILGLFAPKPSVGIYDALRKLINIFDVIISVISRVIFPYLVKNSNRFEKFKNILLLLFIPICATPIFLNKQIATYFTIGDYDVFWLIFILMIGVYCLLLYNIFGVNFFIARGYDKLVMKNTLIASVVGFIVSFPLVYYWGALGAALSLSLSRLFMGGGLTFRYMYLKGNII
mgnify:CR=1 FL=1